jgi:outer membrane protein assembly factor BamB
MKYFKKICYSLSLLALIACNGSADKDKSAEKPEIDSQALIIYSADGSLSSFNLDSNKVNWTYKNPGEIENRDNTFSIENDIIYIPFSKGNVSAINARSGALKWSRQLLSAAEVLNSNKESSDTTYLVNGQSAALHQNLVFVSARNSKLYTLSKQDGKPIWTAALKGPYTNYPPLFIDEFAYTNNQEVLYKFNAADGKLIWENTLNKHPLNAKPVSDGNLVYNSDGIKQLYATNPEGKLVWTFNDPKSDGLTSDKLVMGKEVVYLANGNLKTSSTTIVAVNSKTGTSKWKSLIDGQTILYFELIGSHIFAYSDEVFYMLDAETGKKEFEERFPGYKDIDIGQEKAISNIVQLDQDEVIFLGNNGVVTFNITLQKFSVSYGPSAPHSSFPRNVTWIELLPAKR